MQNVSRRTVAKGAVWATPVLQLGLSSPAMATSGNTADVACSPASASWTDTGLKSYSVREGSLPADIATFGGTSDHGLGGLYEINVGNFGPLSPTASSGATLTQFSIDWVGTAIVRTASGGSAEYPLTQSGNESTQDISAPQPQKLVVDTGIPYHLVAKKPSNYMYSASIPFQVSYVDSTGTSHTCANPTIFYVNICYPAVPDAFGNYPDSGMVGGSGSQWNITANAPATICTPPTVDCSLAAMQWQDTGFKGYDTPTEGSLTADPNMGGTSDNGKGTAYQIQVGQLRPVNPTASNGTTLTDYKIVWGKTAQVKTSTGKSGAATVIGSSTSGSPSNGLGYFPLDTPPQQTVRLDSGIPFKQGGKKAANYLMQVSIPFTVEFSTGNTGLYHCAETTTFYYNVCYPGTPDAFGNYPDSGTVGGSGSEWSITQGSPADIC